MTDELFTEILDALKDRETWEKKQSTYYTIRHTGIPRKKPYPNASDVHGKIGDSFIDKLKPFYVSLLYQGETFATFVAKVPQSEDYTSGAAYWMDYKLKQCSNLESEMMILIDLMCQAGQSTLKVLWDDKKKQLVFDATDPLHIIVPNNTQDIQCADWLVHVLHYSKDQYERKVAKNGWKGGTDFIKSITGKGKGSDAGSTDKDRKEKLREGITVGADDNQIIVFEFYSKLPTASGWDVERFSPLQPTEPITDKFTLPDGYDGLPFVQFSTEIIGKSFLSPRGVIERVASEEAAFNKYWNKLNDWMDFSINASFRVKDGMTNTGNVSSIKLGVGDVLPDWVMPNEMPAPPVDMQAQMSFARSLAEDKIQLPDLGNREHIAGKGESTNQTATKVNAVMALSSQGNDIRARVFRSAFGKVLKISWRLLVTNDKDSYDYVVDNEIQQLDSNALHDKYMIEPNGSPDSWNREAQVGKASLMFQTLQGNPYVPQDELTKDYIENFDPKKVKKLYRDPGINIKKQQEQQAVEILLMQNGYQPDVDPADDDKAHLAGIGQFVINTQQTRKPISPSLAQMLIVHGSEHSDALMKKKDPMLKQIEKVMQPVIEYLAQIAESAPNGMQPQGSPQNMGLQSNSNGATASQDGATQVDTPVDQMNALSALAKSGAPLTVDQLNAALTKAGLPPVVLKPGQVPINPPAEKEKSRL